MTTQRTLFVNPRGAMAYVAPHVIIWSAVGVIALRVLASQSCSGFCAVASGTIIWFAICSALAISAGIGAFEVGIVLLRSRNIDRFGCHWYTSSTWGCQVSTGGLEQTLQAEVPV